MNDKLRSLCTGFLTLPHRFAGMLRPEAMCQRLAAAADLSRQQGRYAQAARLYREALELAQRHGKEDRWRATTYTGLALAYSRLGKYMEAEALHRQALEIYEKARHLEQPHIARCLSNLGALYCHQGMYAKAEAFYQQVLTIQESVLGPMHPEVAVDLNNLGSVCGRQCRYDEAEPLFRRALAIQENALGLDHPDVATTLNNLAFLYQERGRYAEAESLLRHALMVMQSVRGRAHPETALYLNNLAFLCGEQGRDEEAEPLYRRALAIRRKALGPAHPDVATSLENYASLLDAGMRSDEAERLLSQAKAIRVRHAEDLLTRQSNALPGSADRGADEEPPDWVTRLSAAAARTESGSTWRVPDRHIRRPQGALEERKVASGAYLSASSAPVEPQVDELPRALERNELQVYYQPIVSLASGHITGAEALLRWEHPRRGLLSPISFVPLAEEAGLILTIGERLLREACAQRAVWSEAGHPHFRLFVNLSPREFQNHRLPELIRDVLQVTQMPPSALQLEITERVVLHDIPYSVRSMQALIDTGVQIALDDAGTDPSLLLHLEQLPIHAVKLVGTLVRRMASDANAAGVIEAITTMAHSLGLKVIALGVETEEQLALVREQQCDEVQGYMFRRAAPAELFTKFLQTGEWLSTELLVEDLHSPDLQSEIQLTC